MIKTVKIFPSIGVARLGNSRDEYFIGPERPAEIPNPAGGFRDAAGAIKRQAARFHLFGYDENGNLVKELTADGVASLEWSVHLANTKAQAEMFHGKDEPVPPLRNHSVAARNTLRIDPGQVTVSGKNPDFARLPQSRAAGKAAELIVDQTMWNKPVRLSLGTVTTDDRGLLLVMGGYGESKSPTGRPLRNQLPFENFANHDEWYDDVADGRISAKVKLLDGSEPVVNDAWLLVGPPKYAPELQTVVTLYDTLLQKAIDAGLMPDPFADGAFQPSFAADILPILTRAANMRWVYNHREPQFQPDHFHSTFNGLPAVSKIAVTSRLSAPPAIRGNSAAGGGNMPKNWSDQYPGGANGTLTQTQFAMLQKWKANHFVPGTPASMDDPITPEGLTRAALDTCVGGPFYPGIEASWKIRDRFEYVEPFRFDSSKLSPGDVSSQMSLPWQSDFIDCAVEPFHSPAGVDDELVWWPAQRPINVLKPGSDLYIPWDRVSDTGTTGLSADETVAQWPKLGFVLKQADGRYAEESRQP